MEEVDEVEKKQIQEDWKSNMSAVKDRLVQLEKTINKESNN